MLVGLDDRIERGGIDQALFDQQRFEALSLSGRGPRAAPVRPVHAHARAVVVVVVVVVMMMIVVGRHAIPRRGRAPIPSRLARVPGRELGDAAAAPAPDRRRIDVDLHAVAIGSRK